MVKLIILIYFYLIKNVNKLNYKIKDWSVKGRGGGFKIRLWVGAGGGGGGGRKGQGRVGLISCMSMGRIIFEARNRSKSKKYISQNSAHSNQTQKNHT